MKSIGPINWNTLRQLATNKISSLSLFPFNPILDIDATIKICIILCAGLG